MTIAGVFLKTFINTSIVIALLGQLLIASSQPLILSSPGKLASNWFQEDKVNYKF